MRPVNFILLEMTAIRYFIPLAKEAKRKNIKCVFYVGRKGKYNSPHLYTSLVKGYAEKYDFEIRDISEIEKIEGVVFTIEEVGLDLLPDQKNLVKISLAYSGDFRDQSELFRDRVDHICMISQYFVDYYDVNSDKNLFFGTPKFDTKIDANEVLKKYSLKKGTKKALVVYPRRRDLSRIDLGVVYGCIKKQGFDILVKTRGKDPVSNTNHRGDHYFQDASWFPHDTIELMNISDIVINFGSGAVKESVMVGTPIIDFKIKPFKRLFDPLYNYDYSRSFPGEFDILAFENSLKYLTSVDLSKEFERARSECLYGKDYSSSESIIGFVNKKYL